MNADLFDKVTVILLQLCPSLDMTSFNVVAVWCKRLFKFTNFYLVDRYSNMYWYKLYPLSGSVREMIINTLESKYILQKCASELV